MNKSAKNTEPREETPSLVSVTFTRTYNSGEERYVRWQSYDVTSEYAEVLKKKGVI